MRISGYASLFGVVDLARDVVRAGAFGAHLPTFAPMLLEHDPARQIGQWDQLAEDRRGLRVSGILHDRAIATLVRQRRLSGLSIGFCTRSAQPLPDGGRVLLTIDLREVSLVAFPMLPQARLFPESIHAC